MVLKLANVNFATEKLTFEFDETDTNLNQIKDAIKKAGYGVLEEDKSMKELFIPISGMTCASCANAVERALKKLDGMEEANVNFASEKAKIIYDPKILHLSQIKDAVKKLGIKL